MELFAIISLAAVALYSIYRWIEIRRFRKRWNTLMEKTDDRLPQDCTRRIDR